MRDIYDILVDPASNLSNIKICICIGNGSSALGQFFGNAADN